MAFTGARPNRPMFGAPNQLQGNGMPPPNYGGAPGAGINVGPSPGFMGPGVPSAPNPNPGGQPAPMNPPFMPPPNNMPPMPPSPNMPPPQMGGMNPRMEAPRNTMAPPPMGPPQMSPPDPMMGGMRQAPIDTAPTKIPNMGPAGSGMMGQMGGGGGGQTLGGLAGAYRNPGPAMKRPFGQG